MKSWGLKSGAIALSMASAIACSKSEETLDKRQTKLGAVLDQRADNSDQKPAEGGGGEGNAEPKPAELPSVEFEAISLSAAKGLESIPAEELTATDLIEKVSETELVIFGKDGKSYVHTIGSKDAPVELEAAIQVPEGARLYSLPGGQFWFVGADQLGRRKDVPADAANGDAINVEQFSTSSFEGDVKKLKVLYVSASEIIVHLDTHIAILAVKDGKSLLNQFPIEGLPVDLKGTIQAGKTVNDGYWFVANSKLSLLLPNEQGTGLVWSNGQLALPEGATQIAMILDAGSKKALGGTYVFAGGALQEANVPAAE